MKSNVTLGGPAVTHSVNRKALEFVKTIIDNKETLDCRVEKSAGGATIIDAGIECTGTAELGRLIGEVCPQSME